jgi:hypothetical protein
MTPEVTKIVLNKIILNVWIENGPIRDRASISVQESPASEVARGHAVPFYKGHGLPILKCEILPGFTS